MSEFGKSFEKLEGMNIAEKTGRKIEIDKRSDDIFGRIFDDDFPAEKSGEKIEPHLSADSVWHESATDIFDRIFADDLPTERQNADVVAHAPADEEVKSVPDKIFDGIFADDRHGNGDMGELRDGESAESFASDDTGGENVEVPEKKGGSYSEVKATSNGETHEVHHVPADSASPLERGDGPAIKMEREDHRLTASYGGSADAREYREMQRELISEGKFREALQMDIDDIREKFGDKYDDAIGEMLEYVEKLEEEGKIDG